MIQLFDSWAGALSVADYREFAAPYSARVLDAVDVPTIHFATGDAHLLEDRAAAGGDVIGVDWRLPLDVAWERIGHDRGIQGNLDGAVLLGPWERAERGARDVLERAGGPAGPHLQPRPRRAPGDGSGRCSGGSSSSCTSATAKVGGVSAAVDPDGLRQPVHRGRRPAYLEDIRGGRPVSRRGGRRARGALPADRRALAARRDDGGAARRARARARAAGLRRHEALAAADRRGGRARRWRAEPTRIVGARARAALLAAVGRRATASGSRRRSQGASRARASSRAGTTTPPFLDVVADRVRGTDAQVVFTAHSLPQRILATAIPTATSCSRRRASSPSAPGSATLVVRVPERERDRRAVARAGHPGGARAAGGEGVARGAGRAGRLRLGPPRDPLGPRHRGAREGAASLASSSSGSTSLNDDPPFIRALAGVVEKARAVPSSA